MRNKEIETKNRLLDSIYKSNDKSATPSDTSTFERKSSIKRESTILSSYLNMEKKPTIEPPFK